MGEDGAFGFKVDPLKLGFLDLKVTRELSSKEWNKEIGQSTSDVVAGGVTAFCTLPPP